MILRHGLERAADRAAVEFSLGLTLVRLGKRDEALDSFRRAYETRPETIRFGYVYSVAQFDLGKQAGALQTLEQMHTRYPANREVLQLLVGYNQQMGRDAIAKRYASKLAALNGPPQQAN